MEGIKKQLEWRNEEKHKTAINCVEKQNDKNNSDRSPCLNMFRRWIILEPSIFLFLASARMVYFTRQNLFIHVVCRHMNNMTEAECANLTPENRDLVDTHAADLLSNIILLEHVGPIFLCLVSGPFSDRYGRKLPLLVSSAGMTTAYVGYGLLNLLDSDFTMDPRLYLLPSLGISLGGQFFVFFQMFFAYTSDYSNYVQEGDRKFTRFLMAEGSVYFGAVAGSYAGGQQYSLLLLLKLNKIKRVQLLHQQLRRKSTC